MNTKEKVLIIDVMSYSDKKTGEIKTRIGFILPDEKNKKATDNFKGYSELSCFYDGNLVSKVPNDCINQVVEGLFEVKPQQSNPLRTSSILTAIEFKGNVYTLL